MRTVCLVVSICFLVVGFGMVTAPYAAAAVAKKGAGSQISAGEAGHYTALSGATPDMEAMQAEGLRPEHWVLIILGIAALIAINILTWSTW